MSRYVKVEGHSGLYRDMTSGAIINKNENDLRLAKQRRSQREQKKVKEQQLENDVNQLKSDVAEIKSLLSKLAEKL